VREVDRQEDAVDAGFRTFLMWDLSRAVDPSADGAVRESLQAAACRSCSRQNCRDA
jgi:hypothetical protein